MRILVTGATGFIGKYLVQFAADSGYQVTALSRSGGPVKGADTCTAWRLGELPNLNTSESIDIAIHLAHDFAAEEGARRTVTGTIDLCTMLAHFGVRRQIFVSSYSAGRHAKSLYGRTKGNIEEALRDDPSALIVRPGLVLGDGGIYGRMASWARSWPIVPLPDGGRGAVPVIEIDRLCRELVHLFDVAEMPQEFNAFYKDLIPLRDLVLAVGREAGRKPWILPVPTTLLLPLLRVAEAFSIKLPVSSDSLVGFISNQVADHQASLVEN